VQTRPVSDTPLRIHHVDSNVRDGGPRWFVQMPRQYAICEHAHTCLAGRHIVFLDIERDKYLCLDLETTVTLLPHLNGRLLFFEDSLLSECAAWAGVARILAELEQRNLIVQLPLDQTAPRFEQIAPATRSICGATGNKHPRTAAGAGEFILAVTRTAVLLRWRTLAKTVAHVTRRRKSAATSCAGVGPELFVQRFVSYRSRTAKTDACLFNSVALLDFLALHGQYPKLVFGVRMRPFQAHCWVQHEDTVLGDTVERVSQFTPIMAA
jgi:hypothetical protein